VPEIFTGWCGGFAAAYAAIKWGDLAGDPQFRRMGETMCDYISREGITPSGIFYSENVKGIWLQKVFWARPRDFTCGTPRKVPVTWPLSWNMKDKKADIALSGIRPCGPTWMPFLRMQRQDGAIPHEIDGKTGKPLSWVGATSGAWAGALAVYSRIDEDKARGKRYLAAAQKAANYYLKKLCGKGTLHRRALRHLHGS